MKKFLITVLLLFGAFTFISLSAQMANTKDNSNLSQDNNKLYFLVKESFPLNANGNIFLFEEWIDGIITDSQNERFKISLRYRVANEEMQVQHNNKTKALQVQQIKKVEINDRIFIASNFMLNEEKFMSFFEVISDGNIQLLFQYESKEKKGVYSIQKTCYSKKGKAPAEKISFKKKDILNLMKDKKSDIQNFIKKEKINLKKSDDIQKLFKFYNSL